MLPAMPIRVVYHSHQIVTLLALSWILSDSNVFTILTVVL